MTHRPVRVVVATMKLTITRQVASGLPREFVDMKLNGAHFCSIDGSLRMNLNQILRSASLASFNEERREMASDRDQSVEVVNARQVGAGWQPARTVV